MRRAVLLLALTGWVSCGPPAPPPPRARTIVGPDGSRMLHLSCPADEGACYQMAGANCPAGYDVARTHGLEPGNFLVRCRAPQQYPGYAYSALPVAPVPPQPAITASDTTPSGALPPPAPPAPSPAPAPAQPSAAGSAAAPGREPVDVGY